MILRDFTQTNLIDILSILALLIIIIVEPYKNINKTSSPMILEKDPSTVLIMIKWINRNSRDPTTKPKQN
jgi:hypothetical protein